MPDPEVATPAAEAGNAVSRGPGRSRQVAAIRQIFRSRPVRYAFVLAAVALAVFAVARDWAHVRAALISLGIIPVAAALASVLLALGMTVQLWRLLLASLGSPLPVGAAARILLVGQIGKYLPGSIWPVLAQMELARAHEVPRARSASASLLTMLLALITGLLTSLITLPFATGPVPYRWALLALPVLVVMLHPRPLNAAISRLLRLAKQPPLQTRLTARTLMRALVWAFGAWICYGLQIWILATRLGAPAGKTAIIALGAFAFAWSVGFVVVLAPAGAGVRDVLLLVLLGPVLSSSDGAAVALVSRALLTIADLLAAAVASRFTRRPSREVGSSAIGTDLSRR